MSAWLLSLFTEVWMALGLIWLILTKDTHLILYLWFRLSYHRFLWSKLLFLFVEDSFWNKQVNSTSSFIIMISWVQEIIISLPCAKMPWIPINIHLFNLFSSWSSINLIETKGNMWSQRKHGVKMEKTIKTNRNNPWFRSSGRCSKNEASFTSPKCDSPEPLFLLCNFSDLLSSSSVLPDTFFHLFC